MIQKLMFWRGIHVPGPVEVRTAWKYNVLKPRVYFAQGGDTFPSSRYIQRIFNILVDFLEPVHRQNRFFPPSGALTDDDSVIIYDYSAFTSSLDEIHGFIGELATFMDDVEVILIGDLEGPKTVSLGGLLRQFATECNEFAEFDIGIDPSISQIVLIPLGRVYGLPDPIILRHTCGMLGVPGDIQSKTLLHGIHLAFVVGALDRCRCIGDDGKAYRQLQDHLDSLIFEDQLRNIGPISLEKTHRFDFTAEDDFELQSWHYAKRPICRFLNRVLSYSMMVFPTLECILGLSDPLRTSSCTTLNQRRNKFASTWLRLLTVLSVEMVDIPADTRRFLWLYQREAVRMLQIYGRRPGFYRDGDSSFIVPPLVFEEDFGTDPVELVSSAYLYDEEVEVYAEGYTVDGFLGQVDEEFSSCSCPLYTFLTQMGILARENQMEVVSRKMVGDRAFGLKILRRTRRLYRFKVVCSVPDWVYALMPSINQRV
jgi:hypothetical protein